MGPAEARRALSPLLDRIIPTGFTRIIHCIRALRLSHLTPLHLRWLGQLEYPLGYRGPRLKQYVRNAVEAK